MINQLSEDVLELVLFYLCPEDVNKLIIALATSTYDAASLQFVEENRYWEKKVALHFPVESAHLTDDVTTNWYTAFGNLYAQEYISLPPAARKLMSATKENSINPLFRFAHNPALNSYGLLFGFAAAERGHINALKTLCQAGMDCYAQDLNGMTIFHVAAQYGHAEVFHQSEKITARVSHYNDIDDNELQAQLALMFPDSPLPEPEPLPGMIDYQENASPPPEMEHHIDDFLNEAFSSNTFDVQNNRGETPAFLAAQNGHVNVLKTLKKLGANLERANYEGVTPASFGLSFFSEGPATNSEINSVATMLELNLGQNHV